MGVQFDGVRRDALLTLYGNLAGERLSHDDRETYEAALDLVLNDRRIADSVGFLTRNVIRNARYARLRSASSSRRAAAARPLPDAAHRRYTWRTPDGVDDAGLIDHATPEAIALVSETIRELKSFARTVGAHGPICLAYMLASATAAETATTAEVSIPTVERCWRKLREHAGTLLAVAT